MGGRREWCVCLGRDKGVRMSGDVAVCESPRGGGDMCLFQGSNGNVDVDDSQSRLGSHSSFLNAVFPVATICTTTRHSRYTSTARGILEQGEFPRTRVVLPTPWTPLSPMKKGASLCFRCSCRRSRMNGITIGLLSSSKSGISVERCITGFPRQ